MTWPVCPAQWDGAGEINLGSVQVWGDPLSVDPGGLDWHLGPGSPAVDAGVVSGVDADIDADPRPIGRGYDIGADERLLSVWLPVLKKNAP